MIILYILFGILVYICFVLIVGIINFNDNVKKQVLMQCLV